MRKLIHTNTAPNMQLFTAYSWPLAILSMALMLQTTLLTKATLLLGIIILIILNFNIKCPWPSLGQLSKISGLLLLQLLAVGSFAWSFVPYQTIIKVINNLEILLIAFLIAQYSIHKNIVATLKFVSQLLLATIVCYTVLFYGASMEAQGLKAFYYQKNALAPVVVVCLFLLIYAPNFKKLDAVFVVLGLILLGLTQSKTSISLFLVIILITIFIGFFRRIFKSLSAYSQGFLQLLAKLIPIFLYGLIFTMVLYREEICAYLLQNLPKELLTGRGNIWLTVLTRTKDDLLLGIGQGIFWEADALSEISQTPFAEEWMTKLKSADGGYIDMIGSHGFLGLGLLLIAFIQFYKLIMHHASHPIALPAFALITFFVLHNITESSVFRFLSDLWFMFQFLMFYLILLPKDKNYTATL